MISWPTMDLYFVMLLKEDISLLSSMLLPFDFFLFFVLLFLQNEYVQSDQQAFYFIEKAVDQVFLRDAHILTFPIKISQPK